MKNRKVLIVGTGIAGTTLAYWLKRYGFEPTLVERAEQLRTGGYVIDFWGLGYDVAEKMGLLPALKELALPVEGLKIVDEHGKPRKAHAGDSKAPQTLIAQTRNTADTPQSRRQQHDYRRRESGNGTTSFGDRIASWRSPATKQGQRIGTGDF
jgi:2-polyprenyl-6-methoxyphenol hydroxylase-like FAD-dependent oxidoreductase